MTTNKGAGHKTMMRRDDRKASGMQNRTTTMVMRGDDKDEDSNSTEPRG